MLTWTDAWCKWATGREKPWLSYKIGVSATSIHFYFHGMRPYEKTRKRIERLSKGAVPADLPRSSHGLILNSNKSGRKGSRRSVQITRTPGGAQ